MNFLRPKTFKDKKKSWTNFRGLCKSCGICLEVCPKKAIFWGEDLGYYGNPAPSVDIEKCIACGLCELNCPDCAIRVKKKGGKK